MKIKTVILYLAAFFAYFAVSYNTPRVGDDNMYLTKYYRGVNVPPGQYGTWQSVVLAGDTFKRSNEMAVWEFKYDTGRFMDFVCGWHLIPYPKIVFSIVTSFVWLLLMHLIWLLSGLDSRFRCVLFPLSYFLLLQNDASLWMGGSCAYLWPVTWSLVLIPIFQSSRLNESALTRRNLWMWCVLPIVGFCGGGWHEIISVPVCFLLLLYWIREFVRLRKIEINGRLLMTVFYGLGSLTMVFAPSSLARFGRQSGASFVYTVLTKSMSLANTVVFNPLVLLTLIVVVVMLVKKDSRKRLLNVSLYWLLMLAAIIGIVCFLGEGAERTSWPVSVISLIVLLRILPMGKFFESHRQVWLMTSAILGVLTFVYSWFGVVKTRHDHERVVHEWFADESDLCAIPDNPDSLLAFLFDRSLPARSLIWFGHGPQNMNPSLAAKFNRDILLGLPESARRAFGSGNEFCIADREVKIGDEIWYADPQLDILVRPLTGCEEERFHHGQEVMGAVKYTSREKLSANKFVRILRDDIDLYLGGLAIFKTSNFYQRFSRDIIYSTLYSNKPDIGFVVKTSAGLFVVLQHNRYNNRGAIAKVSLQ